MYFNNVFKHKVLVSATCDDTKIELLEKIAPLVYKKVAKEAEQQGALNKANYFFVSYKLDNYENKRYLSFNNRYATLLANDGAKRNAWRLELLNRDRNIFLNNLDSAVTLTKDLIENVLKNPDAKVLVFAGSIEQAERISKYTYHSKSDKDYLTDFNNGKIRVVIVVGKIDRGVNLIGVNNVIFTAPTRSYTKTSQRTGRARRLHKDDFSNVFFLLPLYRKAFGTELIPTVVQARIIESSKDLDLRKAKYIRYDKEKRLFTSMGKTHS